MAGISMSQLQSEVWQFLLERFAGGGECDAAGGDPNAV